jgi:hypothetical protein
MLYGFGEKLGRPQIDLALRLSYNLEFCATIQES